jgi:hypothetical protein
LPRKSWLSNFLNKDNKFSDFIQELIKKFDLQDYKLIYRLSLPASAEIKLFGDKIITDIFLFAIQYSKENKNFNSQTGFVDLCLSKKFLMFYNSEISDGKVFPKLSSTILKALPIKIIVGQSSFFQSNSQFSVVLK